MLREGHIGISLLIAAPILTILMLMGSILEAIVIVGAITVGGGFPDIDQKIPFVKHRGFLHTIWFAVIFGVGVGVVMIGVATLVHEYNELLQNVVGLEVLYWLSFVAAVGAGIGVISHLVGDMITPWGITPFEPIDDRKIKYELTKATNQTANNILLVTGGISLFLGGSFGLLQLI